MHNDAIDRAIERLADDLSLGLDYTNDLHDGVRVVALRLIAEEREACALEVEKMLWAKIVYEDPGVIRSTIEEAASRIRARGTNNE